LIAPAHADHLVPELLDPSRIVTCPKEHQNPEQESGKSAKAMFAKVIYASHQSPAPTGVAGA
jgi:hypothetical protein